MKITLRHKSAALVSIGFGSILSQILLLREFLVSFYGNELSLGIIFAWWLVWIGIGSAAGNRIVRRIKNIPFYFTLLIALTPFILIAQILAVQFARCFLQSTMGEFLSMLDLFIFSGLILSIGCAVWGALFTLGASLMAAENDEAWRGVNKSYVLESFGSVCGGLLFSFVLVSYFTTFQTVLFLSLFLWTVVFIAVSQGKRRIQYSVIAGMVIIFIILLHPFRHIEHLLLTRQWLCFNDQLTFIHAIDTKYQNLSLVRLHNQHTIYSDGRPLYNIPNTYDAETFIHTVMIQRANARSVLVLGGGFNGVLKEIEKYPVKQIDYVETDAQLLSFVGPVLDSSDLRALHHPRVNIITDDGREFLRRTEQAYDVIIVNAGEPSTASINRFYTLEFYQQCALRMKPEGILAFMFPSSAEYLAGELMNLNASVYHTAKMVFNDILIVPGDHAILIGAQERQTLMRDPEILAGRFDSTGIRTEYFSRYEYDEHMPRNRTAFIAGRLEAVEHYRINTDKNPVLYFYDLLLWNRYLQDDNSFFSFITPPRIMITGGVCAGVILLFLIVPKKQKELREQTALGIIIGIIGMTGMALNLLFILNFQETFGSIYEMIGAMTAANLLGLAAGALMTSMLLKVYAPKRCIIGVLSVLLLIVLSLPALFGLLVDAHVAALTLSITMLNGILVGMTFGIVNKLYLQLSRSVGTVYALDVVGSSFGALTTCTVLLPLLGIESMMWFMLMFLSLAVVAALSLRTENG